MIKLNRPIILYENNKKYKRRYFDEVNKSYPQYKANSDYNLESYCMNELKYSKVIHQYGGGIDDLLIP